MRAKRSVDVVVVGAGPAGTMTAKFAARGGADVLILEKRQEIGSPVRCGEGLSRKWFAELGIEEDPSWLVHEVKGLKLYSPNGSVLEIDESYAGKEAGIVIDRDIFDRALARDAVRAGADILVKATVTGLIIEDGAVRGVHVEHLGERFDVEAKVVVGADGFESKVARWAGIDTTLATTDIVPCYQYQLVDIDVDPDYCEYYVDEGIKGGYVWVFPKGAHTANVGLGITLAHIRTPGEVKAKLDHWIAQRPHLAPGEPLSEIAGAVSSCAPLEETVGDGVLIVGDAARQIDPLTGGGICNSCHCAKIAGDTIAGAIARGNVSKAELRDYDRGWRELYENEMYRNWMARETLVELEPAVVDKVIDALGDCDISEMTTLELLRAVEEKYPELVEEFSDLLF